MIKIIYKITTCFNMLAVSILFAPWSMPRETLSGLAGRWSASGVGWQSKFGLAAAVIIDLFHPHEPDHCMVTAAMEAEARKCYQW